MRRPLEEHIHAYTYNLYMYNNPYTYNKPYTFSVLYTYTKPYGYHRVDQDLATQNTFGFVLPICFCNNRYISKRMLVE